MRMSDNDEEEEVLTTNDMKKIAANFVMRDHFTWLGSVLGNEEGANCEASNEETA